MNKDLRKAARELERVLRRRKPVIHDEQMALFPQRDGAMRAGLREGGPILPSGHSLPVGARTRGQGGMDGGDWRGGSEARG